MLLATAMRPVPFDLYLLRYRAGVQIPTHVDPVPGKRHFRLNFAFGSYEGGEFVCDKVLARAGRLVLFRPDIAEHSVSPVHRGTRWVVSLGFVRPE